MKYALLIYENEQVFGPQKAGPVMDKIVGRHRAFVQGLGAAHVGGAGLKAASTATTVRTKGGVQSIHDGPFAEAREQLGGFHLVEAPDLDAAIAIARKVPLTEDGAIEVRPVLGPG